MKITSNESALHRIKYIKNIVTGLLMPQQFTKPHYLSDDSQIILTQNYNKDKKDSYNIETRVIFSKKQFFDSKKEQELGSSHLIDTLQNLADIVGYFSNEIIKLDRLIIPSYLDDNKDFFEKYIYSKKEINIQNLFNVVPLNQDISFKVGFNFDELNPNITLVNYHAQVSFKGITNLSEEKYLSLFFEGTGQTYPYLNRPKLEKILRNRYTSLFKWK